MFRNTIFLVAVVAIAQLSAAVTLQVNSANPVLLERRTQTTLVQLNLVGAEPADLGRQRMPVNLAVVVDESGSMGGDRIERAKEAARTVVSMLGPQDVFSLVAYSDEAITLVPATKMTDRNAAYVAIERIEAAGSTALFAGVSKGLSEVRKFHERNRVNRVVLLSDGMANVGPSSPGELASLGRAAGREGISVTTIGLGLGYNEDLMSQLAMASDGNHAFVENSVDLARVFEQELGGVLSVVAQRIQINIQCPSGVRPLRVLDQNADIRGQNVQLNYNQIYGRQNKSVLLEVEVTGKREGEQMELAQVQVLYDDPTSKRRETQQGKTVVRFTASESTVRREVYKPALVEAARAKTNIASKKALELRDKGDLVGAGAIMKATVDSLQVQAVQYNAPELAEESKAAEQEAQTLSAPAPASEMNKSRKELKARQYERSSKFSIQKSK